MDLKMLVLPLRYMINAEVVEEYHPLTIIDGSFTSQFEYIFMILSIRKEFLLLLYEMIIKILFYI